MPLLPLLLPFLLYHLSPTSIYHLLPYSHLSKPARLDPGRVIADDDTRFMANKNDDVTLPFSVLDAVVGDVFSVLWEPDMMAEMGSALKILTSEVLTSGLQQVLAATALTALMSAIQWPISEYPPS